MPLFLPCRHFHLDTSLDSKEFPRTATESYAPQSSVWAALCFDHDDTHVFVTPETILTRKVQQSIQFTTYQTFKSSMPLPCRTKSG